MKLLLAALICLASPAAAAEGRPPSEGNRSPSPERAESHAFAQKGMDKFFLGDLEGAVADWESARRGSRDPSLDRLALLGLRVLAKEELLSDDFLRAGVHAGQALKIDPEASELMELEALARQARSLLGQKNALVRRRLDPGPDRQALISAAMMFDLRPAPKAKKRRTGGPELRDFVARALAPELAAGHKFEPPRPKREALDLHFTPPPEPEEEYVFAEEEALVFPDYPGQAPYAEGQPLQRRPRGAAATAEEDTRRGLELYYRGDYKGALSCFHSALSRDLESKKAQASFVMAMAAWNNKRAEYHYQEGLGAYYRGDLDGAAKHFRQALQFNPKLDGAHKGLRLSSKT